MDHSLRIYAAADLHGRWRHVAALAEGLHRSRADVLVLAGDLLQYGRGRGLLSALEAFPVPVLMVRGNSDPVFVERWAKAASNLRPLHRVSVAVKGFDFIGASGTVPIPFYSLAGWREPRILAHLAPMIHSRSILVAHPPPRGCCDRVLGRFHAGSRGIARLVLRTAPAVMICGHIHEAAGVDRLGTTLVVNCALGMGRRGALIVLEEGHPPRAEPL